MLRSLVGSEMCIRDRSKPPCSLHCHINKMDVCSGPPSKLWCCNHDRPPSSIHQDGKNKSIRFRLSLLRRRRVNGVTRSQVWKLKLNASHTRTRSKTSVLLSSALTLPSRWIIMMIDHCKKLLSPPFLPTDENCCVIPMIDHICNHQKMFVYCCMNFSFDFNKRSKTL